MAKLPITTNIICAIIIASIPFSAFASDWDEDKPSNNHSTTTGKSSPVLRGHVEHSDKLPSLGDDLQAGANFNPNASAEAKYASSWFKIPSWFAGTFQAQEATIDFVKDYATGKTVRPNQTIASSGQELHGYQKDANGDIWHFYVKSGSSKSDQTAQFTVNNIDWYGPEYVSDDKVVMRFLATSLVVDKRSGIIVDSFRREDIKTYEPLSPGVLKVTYTSKSFDSHGQPRDLQDGHSVYRQIARFQPIDRDNEHDYRQMLKDFLSNEPGSASRIPQRTKRNTGSWRGRPERLYPAMIEDAFRSRQNAGVPGLVFCSLIDAVCSGTLIAFFRH